MTPAALLEELLRYHKVKSSETVDFFARSHDEICRAVLDQIDVMLGAFEKYQHISYMTQGPRDNGVDVLLKGTVKNDEPEKFFALQIKSYNELEDRDNQLARNLKAGLVDAQNSYQHGLERYYILLCGDATKHAKRITGITNEFTKLKQVRVIGPRELLAYLRMPPTTIAAVIDRHLSEDDYVRKRARANAASYRPRQLYFILACICWALNNSTDVLPNNFFEDDPRMLALEERFGDGSVVACLDRSADSDLETHAEPYTRRVRLEDFQAIRALYYDLQVRYEESSDELFDHLYEFLREGSDDSEREKGE
jgi:hypothetical protein